MSRLSTMLINITLGPVTFLVRLIRGIPGFIDLTARVISKTVDDLIVWALDSFNRKSPVLIHIPVMRAIGDGAEEIYFGLLKARREGKTILFPCPHRLSSSFSSRVTSRPSSLDFPARVANRELIKIESEYCYLRCNSPWRYLADWIFTIILGILRVLYLVWRTNLRIVQLNRPKYRPPTVRSRRFPGVRRWYPDFERMARPTLWKPDGIDYFSWDIVQAYDWREQFNEPLAVGLAPEKRRRAEQLRVKMGIPLEDWFVCLHVKETQLYNGIHPDIAEYEGASILNYTEAIRTITAAGGWVVRMGDSTMTRLPPMERVIDYPFTPFKSESMDMYLFRECRFFFGMASGPCDVSRLFQKRSIMVNLAEWSTAFPVYKGDLCIIKHIFSRSRNRFLSLRELLEEPSSECQAALGSVGEDYIIVENTPEEIRDVVQEFLGKPDEYQYSELQEEFNHRRRLQIHRWLEGEFSIPSNPLDLVDKYRYASRADSVEGTIGQKYLEQNWLADSLGENMPDQVKV